MPFLSAAGRSLEYEWIEGDEPRWYSSTRASARSASGAIFRRAWRRRPAAACCCTTATVTATRTCWPRRASACASCNDEALESLPRLLAALGVEAPVLVGHSDGASIALIHAGSGHPGRGHVRMAPHVFVEAVCIRSIAQAKRTFETSDLRERLGKYHRDPAKTFYLWNDVWRLLLYRCSLLQWKNTTASLLSKWSISNSE